MCFCSENRTSSRQRRLNLGLSYDRADDRGAYPVNKHWQAVIERRETTQERTVAQNKRETVEICDLVAWTFNSDRPRGIQCFKGFGCIDIGWSFSPKSVLTLS